MKQTFTPNDLVRFIYREVSSEEEIRIKNAITASPEVADEFQKLMESVIELDSLSFEPSESSVNIILDFSQHMMAEESHA